ncbi:MAG: GNAT family N-acetyltransferase [Rhodobacteraceae bacterium]|nr:GNAT family N-acetyltransferase [Paracoccaceae bacterium]
MTAPPAADLLAALEATWPPRARARVGPWVIRDGMGGGSRVSAATAAGPVTGKDVAAAVAAMAALGQAPVVQVRPGQADLDAVLAALGWRIADPTLILAMDIGDAGLACEGNGFATAWPPDAAAGRLWDRLGIGAARQAVMDRVAGPKTVIAAEVDGHPAGLVFAALDQRIGMVHAMAVDPAFRRRGLARGMLAAAARWARQGGADTLALAVTDANGPARALYGAAGFVPVTGYHYRIGAQG